MNISTVNELIQSLESAGELSIKETKVMALAKAYLDVAAENMALKSEVPLGAIENGRAFADRLEAYPFECQAGNLNMCSDWQELRRCFEHLSEWAMHGQSETPATDCIVAGIKADGRIEGINFAAGRLAAAFNHGFVDKSMAEVYDVVRMILTAKEDLANDPVLAADGLSGEYAEKSLAEWEAELREGADK